MHSCIGALSRWTDLLIVSAAALRLEHITGLAFPERDENGKIERAKMAIFGLLETLIKAEKKILIVLDDLGTGTEIIQKAFLHVFDGEINGMKVSEHVILCGATNSREDLAGVRGIIEPLKSRFHVFFKVEADLNYFCSTVAVDCGMHTNIPDFLMFENGNGNDYLSVFDPDPGFKRHPSPRTWEFLSDIMHAGLPSETTGSDRIDDVIINGVIGKKVGRKFFHFVKTQLSQMPKAIDVLNDPSIWDIKVEHDGMGIKYLMANQIARIVTPHDIKNAIIICDKLPRMLQGFFMTLVRENNPANCRNNEYIQWKSRPENKAFDIGYSS